MKLLHIILGLVLLLQVGYAGAQELSTLSIGDRVRIKAPSFSWDQISGNIVTMNADTLVLKSEKQTSLLKVPLTYVTGLGFSKGKKNNAGKGAGVGLLIGATVGAVIGIGSTDDCSSSQGICVGGNEFILVGGVILGGIGSAAGIIIGSFIHTEAWEEMPIDRIRLGISPQHQGGLAFSASVAF